MVAILSESLKTSTRQIEAEPMNPAADPIPAILESEATGEIREIYQAVSYTHLTLPTNREV